MRNIKQGTALLLTLMLVISAAPTSFAVDYHRLALDYLAENLEVSADIIVVDGSLQDLSYIGEQFWIGRYRLTVERDDAVPGSDSGVDSGSDPGRDSPVSSGDGESSEPADGRQPLPGKDAIEPYPVPGSHTYGTVTYRVKTDEFLTDEEAQPFFERERQLQQEEWERLSKEAGNIAVTLYSKLIDAASDELFTVVIWTRYVETEEMRSAMEEIYDDYPDLHFGFSLLPHEGEGESGNSGAPDEFHILPMPIDTEDGLEEGWQEDSRDKPVHDDALRPEPGSPPDDMPGELTEEELEIQRRYEEAYQRLEEVFMLGFADSASRLKDALGEMGVKYDSDSYSPAVQCDLTASQILSLKEAEYVDSIGEELYFRTMDESSVALDSTEDAAAPAMTTNTPTGSGSLYLWLIPVLVLLAGGLTALIVVRRRNTCSQQ